MAKTFIVRDERHPLFGRRVQGFDGSKGRRWAKKKPLVEPADVALVNRLCLTREHI